MMGLPFFSPAYQKGFGLSLCGVPPKRDQSLQDVVSAYLSAPYFPVPLQDLMPSVCFRELERGAEYQFGDATVKTVELNHPGGATGYRISHRGASVCYITDVEHQLDHPSVSLKEFVRETDVLIYDSTYTDAEYLGRIGWGHSTWQEAIRIGTAANVKRIVLFHHDPSHDDLFMRQLEAEALKVSDSVLVSRDGMLLSI
jgi:phosphoribosyl 1,2-cyclic phosphodiesterase